MPRRRRSPQEKKQLSLARDNLMRIGESPHALRKHWKKKKRNAERARRTAERIALETRPDEFAPVRRRTVRKWGTARLGEQIAQSKASANTARKSAAARERRRLRRGKKRRRVKAPSPTTPIEGRSPKSS